MTKGALPPNTWPYKARALIVSGWSSVKAFAEKTGREERALRNWLPDEDGNAPRFTPRGERAEVQRLAEDLGVPTWWLENAELRGDPPKRDPGVDQWMERVPARFRRLIWAARDEAVADWLLAQLDLLERAPRRGRSSA